MKNEDEQLLAEVMAEFPEPAPLTPDEIDELERLDAMRRPGCYEL